MSLLVDISNNTLPKITDYPPIRKICKVDIQHQDMYDILIDSKGNEFTLDGLLINDNIISEPKITDYPPIRKICKVDIQHQDIYDILIDSKGNEFTLDGKYIPKLCL